MSSPSPARRSCLRPSTIVTLSTLLLLMVLPNLAEACPVCNSVRNESSRIAFLVTTAFLSLLPLGVIGGFVWWLRNAARKVQS